MKFIYFVDKELLQRYLLYKLNKNVKIFSSVKYFQSLYCVVSGENSIDKTRRM